MNPEQWGPHAWVLLHTITINYTNYPTKQDKIHYRNFFTSLQHCLPCDACANHYAQNLQRYPLTDEVLSSRTNLVFWLIKIHNSVNIMNGKPIVSNQKAVQIYHDMYRPKTMFDHIVKHIDVVLMLLILVVICILEKSRIMSAVCSSNPARAPSNLYQQ